MMKKTVLIGILLVSVVGMAFAASTAGDANTYQPSVLAYALTAEPYAATSVRTTGLGGASLGMEGYSDSFLSNPANLGTMKFKLSLPTVTVTMFNVKNLLEGDFFDDLQTYMASTDSNDLTSVVNDLLMTLSNGQNEVERIDAGFNLAAGPMGLAVQAQQRLFGYLPGSSYTGGSYVAQVTAAVTLGFGYRIPIGDMFSVDLGASGQFVYRMYSEKLKAGDFTDLAMGNKDYMTDIPLVAGYAFPIKAGVNVNMPFGFKVSAVGRNFNGKFTYTVYDNLQSYVDNFSPEVLYTAGAKNYTYDDGYAFDAGLTWKPPLGGLGNFLQPTLTVDVLDLGGIDADASPFWYHVYAGVQARVLSFLDLRYGIAQGYQSIGVGFDLLIFHIDASYWRQQYTGSTKSVDALSVRFSLGTT